MMSRSFLLFTICVILPGCGTASQAQLAGPAPPDPVVEITDSGGPLMPEQAAYDVTFYDLDLEVRPETRSIAGVLTVNARLERPVRFLVLNLDTVFAIESVTQVIGGANGPDLNYLWRGGQVWVELPVDRAGDQVSVRIAYGGKPRVAVNPPWGDGFTWAQTEDGRPWIATSVQGGGADLWFPVKDHPSDEPDSMALRVTVPEDLIVASNGVLRGVEAAGGRKTYHWFVASPINNYNVALNIAPYRTVEARYTSVAGETVPVTFWVLPEAYEQGQASMPEFLRHLAFFEKQLGPYPFRAEKYGIAHTPFLGMEHQTIIAYGSDFDKEPDGYDWLHFHELSHEWWGNLVTARDWKDFWLHEGTTMYMQALYTEELFGREAYLDVIRGYRGSLLNLIPVAPRESRTTDQIYFVESAGVSNGDIYVKGGAVLHTLRYLIGEEAMATLLRRFLYPSPELEQVTNGSQTRFVDTEDFIRLAEEVSGRELDWFFDIYLRQPALPELVQERTAEGVRLSWRTPGDLPFPMPINVVVDGEVRRVEVPEGGAVVSGGQVTTDPEGWVLRE